MVSNDELRDKLARLKIVIDHGDSWTGLFYGKFLMTMMFIKLFEDFFNSLGVPIIVFYVLGMVPIFTLNFIIGWLNLKVGFWPQYMNIPWYYSSVGMGLVEDVKDIKGKVCDEEAVKR